MPAKLPSLSDHFMTCHSSCLPGRSQIDSPVPWAGLYTQIIRNPDRRFFAESWTAESLKDGVDETQCGVFPNDFAVNDSATPLPAGKTQHRPAGHAMEG